MFKLSVIGIFGFSTETERSMCVHIHIYTNVQILYIYKIRIYIYYKKLAQVIMKAAKYKICRVSRQAGDPVEPIAQFQSTEWLLENFLLEGRWSLCSVQSSTDRMMPTHIMENNLFYSKSIE